MTRRRCGESNAKRRVWYIAYRSRMSAGYETCRNNSCERLATTFGHILAVAKGGRWSPSNLTLLCESCNNKQGSQYYEWLKPLISEPDYLDVIGQDMVCAMGPSLIWSARRAASGSYRRRRKYDQCRANQTIKEAIEYDYAHSSHRWS